MNEDEQDLARIVSACETFKKLLLEKKLLEMKHDCKCRSSYEVLSHAYLAYFKELAFDKFPL